MKRTIINPYAKRPRPSVERTPPARPNGPMLPSLALSLQSPHVSTDKDGKLLSSKLTASNRSNETDKQSSFKLTGIKSTAAGSSTTTNNQSNDNETTSASALVIAASDKAGMEGIDRQRIDAIILRESGNSLFMQQQRRRDEQVNQRIANLKEKLRQAPPGWEQEVHKQLEAQVPEILARRPTRSTAVVVDMDQFYMACELLTRPDLKERPACVGRGMILTSNYKARKYGVRSAMAGWIGDKLVQELSEGKEKLIHVPSNFSLYKEKSRIVKLVLAEYDPHLKAYSLDEAYINLGPYLALKLTKGWNHKEISKILSNTEEEQRNQESEWTKSQAILATFSPSQCLQAARETLDHMRKAVYNATGGLTCSAGLAPNFLLAKIASDRNKPNGQCLVGPDHKSDVIPFLYCLPVRKVGGIGRVTEKILQAFGIQTVEDLFQKRALVRFLFKPATAGSLLRASLGCSSRDGAKEDDNEDEEETGQKGISRERTFQSGKPWLEINAKLEEIAHLLAADMAAKNLQARTVTIKVKLYTFEVLSRSKSLARGVFVHEPCDLVALSSEILRSIRNDFTGLQFSVRLLGIRCTNFKTEQDISSGTFRIEDYFRGTPEKKPSRAQRSLDSFFAESKAARKTTSGEEKATPDVTRVVCPICEQASFSGNDNIGLNRHIDVCLGPSQPAKKRKRKLSDFWT